MASQAVPLSSELQFLRGRDTLPQLPHFVEQLPEFCFAQRFAAHYSREMALRNLQAAVELPAPNATLLGIDATGAPVVHLQSLYCADVPASGVPILEIAYVATGLGHGWGREILALFRSEAGPACLVALTDPHNQALYELARNRFDLIYSPRLWGVARLPGVLLSQADARQWRDPARAEWLRRGHLHLLTPIHQSAASPWRPLSWNPGSQAQAPAELEQRLLWHLGAMLRQRHCPATAAALQEAFHAAYDRELSTEQLRPLRILHRQRILAAIRRDGVIH